MTFFISSIMGSIKENSGGYYGYRASKAAMNSLAITLAHEFKKLKIELIDRARSTINVPFQYNINVASYRTAHVASAGR